MKSFRVRPAASIAVAVATVLASGGLFAGPAAAAEPPSLHASPTPLLWPRSGLESVSATGPDDVWAAGYQGYQGFWWAWEGLGGTYVHVLQPKAVVTRWNGTSWQTHDLPGTGGDARAERIEAGAPGNVWVQGTLHPHHVFNGTAHYIARWDGARWRQVSLPSTDCRPRLEDADASGAWFDCSGDVFRWEGGTWTRYDTDPEGQSTGVSAISSLSAGSAWAATTENLLRWDGSRWSPAPGLPEGGYWYDVLAVSATEVWAAGLAPGDGGRKQVVYRWDGAVWHEEAPRPSDGDDLYRAGDGTMWTHNRWTGELHRLDGGTWTPVDVPLPDDGEVNGVTTVPGAPTLWAVGETGDVPLVYRGG
ncbi:hypothetical protein [Actinomadura algeriensis]|uniref:Tachylectin n=1 Tax=Actinomadura algeriensis TaxID=1679523 RepID=A0ABR9JQJ5_9ACTN|nr:hypothetical protein [Actinomadura algeriensis]MBE1532802.1 hypothetical protein [Actinomadura algeriensis]